MQERMIDEAQVKQALQSLKDPETGRSVVEMAQVHEVKVGVNQLKVTLGLTTHSAPLWQATVEQAESLLRAAFPGVANVEVVRAVHVRRPEKIGEIGLTAKSVIVVGSGKGGVGKSTVATELAYGLRRAGCEVGLVGADV